MKTGFSIPVRAVVAAALAALVAVVFVGLPSPTEASSHSATREFSSSWVLPGSEFSVTITFDNLGLGQVAESLPEGFTYLRSDLGGVEVEGQFLTIFIIGDSSVTYTLMAPDTEGEFIFTGVVRDLNGAEELIGGGSSIRVGPAPTPVPTSTPTNTPTPTPTNTPTPTATPTSTPTPQPTATPCRRPLRRRLCPRQRRPRLPRRRRRPCRRLQRQRQLQSRLLRLKSRAASRPGLSR